MSAIGFIDSSAISRDIDELNSDLQKFEFECVSYPYGCPSSFAYKEYYTERLEEIVNRSLLLKNDVEKESFLKIASYIRIHIDIVDKKIRNRKDSYPTTYIDEIKDRVYEALVAQDIRAMSSLCMDLCRDFCTKHFEVPLAISSCLFSKPATHQWTDLVPSAVVLSLGCLISPSFRIGAIPTIAIFSMFNLLRMSFYVLLYFDQGIPLSSHRLGDRREMHPFHGGVVIPILEELEFRGILQNLISFAGGKSAVSAGLAIFISAVLFGLMHFDSQRPNAVLTLGITLILGFICSVFNEEYGILAPIGAHIGWNSTLDLIAYLFGWNYDQM